MRTYTIDEMKRAFECGRNFQLTAENNFQELIEELNQPSCLGALSSSVTYNGITYYWGDKVVSPNGYHFFVVTDEGRWGLVDDGGTFCELKHCDLTEYLHCS